MNYANIKRYDVANSIGIASSIFFSGCKFNCYKCFNKEAQDFNYGKPYTKEIEDLYINYLKDEHVVCANLLGGEVFQQDLNVILNLVKRIKTEINKPIWVWTGYKYEQLLKDENKVKILNYIDILIDGQFENDKKDMTLRFRGSSNQRVINVQESLKQGKVVLWEDTYDTI